VSGASPVSADSRARRHCTQLRRTEVSVWRKKGHRRGTRAAKPPSLAGPLVLEDCILVSSCMTLPAHTQQSVTLSGMLIVTGSSRDTDILCMYAAMQADWKLTHVMAPNKPVC